MFTLHKENNIKLLPLYCAAENKLSVYVKSQIKNHRNSLGKPMPSELFTGRTLCQNVKVLEYNSQTYFFHLL